MESKPVRIVPQSHPAFHVYSAGKAVIGRTRLISELAVHVVTNGASNLVPQFATGNVLASRRGEIQRALPCPRMVLMPPL